jgi:23S rRNA (pseudouridine1915-N3)-methyltransferase
MKTIFLLTGKTRNSYLTEGIKEYQKRIVHYLPFELREIPDLKNVKNFSPEQVKEMEGTQILHSVSDGDILVFWMKKAGNLIQENSHLFWNPKCLEC